MFEWILQLLADASGAGSAVVSLGAAFFVLIAVAVTVALAGSGERAERALVVLRLLLRSRLPRE